MVLRPLLPTLLAALALACKPSASEQDSEPIKLDPAELPAATETIDAPSKRLRAAGVEIAIPNDWIVLAEDDPNFALAHGSDKRSTHIPVCSIELRRQGLGPLPDGSHELAEHSGVFQYDQQLGAVRGRIRTFAGPNGWSVVVNCRAPRATKHWAVVADAVASAVATSDTVELPPLRSSPGPEAIVELCVGSPARMTSVCARRADGSVYCGATTGDTLTRVSLPMPAVQISCGRKSGCARDAEGKLQCWRGSDPPEPVTDIEGARDITNTVIVDRVGRLWWRGETGISELVPHDDPALRWTDVDRALAGSKAGWGCVLRNGELWCWGHDPELSIGFDRRPQLIAPAPGATDLRRSGERVCTVSNGRWTCHDGQGKHEFDGCEMRACGCSLFGATRISCEHEPNDTVHVRPLGWMHEVVIVAEPCAALADGTVMCRGPVAGQKGQDPGAGQEDPRTKKAIASGLPGIAHVLELR
jgi:hypothetical protein